MIPFLFPWPPVQIARYLITEYSQNLQNVVNFEDFSQIKKLKNAKNDKKMLIAAFGKFEKSTKKGIFKKIQKRTSISLGDQKKNFFVLTKKKCKKHKKCFILLCMKQKWPSFCFFLDPKDEKKRAYTKRRGFQKSGIQMNHQLIYMHSTLVYFGGRKIPT